MIDRQIVAREEAKYKAQVKSWYAQKDEEVKMEGRPEWIYHQRLEYLEYGITLNCRFIGHNPSGGAKVEFLNAFGVDFWLDYSKNNIPYDKLTKKEGRLYDIGGNVTSRPEKLTWDKLRGEQ